MCGRTPRKSIFSATPRYDQQQPSARRIHRLVDNPARNLVTLVSWNYQGPRISTAGDPPWPSASSIYVEFIGIWTHCTTILFSCYNFQYGCITRGDKLLQKENVTDSFDTLLRKWFMKELKKYFLMRNIFLLNITKYENTKCSYASLGIIWLTFQAYWIFLFYFGIMLVIL